MITILVVDDEPDFEQLIKERFRREVQNGELEFSFAENGVIALDKLNRQPDVNIILTDINMPEMDGLTLLSKIDKTNLLRKTVVVSAYGDMQNIRSAMNNGAYDFITKPIDFKDLKLTITKTIQHINELREIKLKNTELAMANEVLREAIELRDDLIGIASHDLRNPLQSVMGFAQLLIEEIEKNKTLLIEDNSEFLQKVEKRLKTIYKASEQMHDIVTGLLESKNLENGKIKLQLQQIDISQLIAMSMEQYQFKASKKNQNLIFDTPFGCLVNGDWARLHEVIDNLISNAIKYSPHEKRIWIKTEKKNGYVLFSVRDEGPGLSEEDMQKIFGKFQRLSAKPTGGESSTGLGLAIVKQLIELHGGKVWAESKGENMGSLFIIELKSVS